MLQAYDAPDWHIPRTAQKPFIRLADTEPLHDIPLVVRAPLPPLLDRLVTRQLPVPGSASSEMGPRSQSASCSSKLCLSSAGGGRIAVRRASKVLRDGG